MFGNLFKKKESEDEILIEGVNNDTGRPKDDNRAWIKIEGEPMKDGRLRLEADWTPGMVDYLRENYNFGGSSEDAIVHKFIAELHAQLMTEMKEEGRSEYE